jgi:glycosyltransferase involved in cell wall biosynthesis
MNKARPNVAIVVRCIYDYRLPLYKDLHDRGNVHITVFHSTRDLQDHSKTATSDEIKEFALNVKGYLFHLGKARLIVQPSIPLRTLFGRYDTVVCEYGKSIVSSLISLFLCKLTGKRFIWWAAGWERSIYPKLGRAFKVYNSFFWKLADGAIVFHSNAFHQLTKARTPKGKVYIAQNTRDDRPILRNWDYTIHRSQVLRKSLGLQSSDKIILYVGALIKRKRVDVLIKAFGQIAKRYQHIYLVIVGDGSEKQPLDNLIKELDIPRVMCVGGKTTDVYDYFAMCNVCVLPGLGGLAINDAMICRKPVVCSSADGSEKDLIENGVTGYIIADSVFSEEILADRILSVIGDEKRNAEMGDKAYVRYMKMATFDEMVNNFERAILDL